jgi:hypothetical protein
MTANQRPIDGGEIDSPFARMKPGTSGLRFPGTFSTERTESDQGELPHARSYSVNPIHVVTSVALSEESYKEHHNRPDDTAPVNIPSNVKPR